MSEYWKSVPRKFCEFCKCWITDNKPSVDFHERGKRHQENVELRLREVRKKSVQEAREKEQMETEMAKMEKAALEAFKKDLKDNPELAAQYGVSLEPKPKSEAESSTKDTSTEGASSNKGKKKRKRKKKEWYEAVSDGHSYYWSTVTGDSTWTAPEEYVSIVEQAEEEAAAKEEEEEERKARQINNEKAEESTNQSSSEPQSSGRSEAEPAVTTRTGFGSWEVVREERQAQVYDETSAPPDLGDIPLPSAPTTYETQPPKPERPKFKEKTVTSLGPAKSGPVAFKKRKVAAGARNTRTRDNDG